MSSVVNVKVKFLRKNGVQNLEEWLKNDDNIYIGRNMEFYVPGATSSKWRNPFSIKKYGRDECLEKYKEYILKKINENPEIYNLNEINGKNLGCWCAPEPCHGNILIEIINDLN